MDNVFQMQEARAYCNYMVSEVPSQAVFGSGRRIFVIRHTRDQPWLETRQRMPCFLINVKSKGENAIFFDIKCRY